MFTWGKTVLLALSLITSLVSWMRERKLLTQAELELYAKIIKANDDIIQEAEKARSDARAANDTVSKSDSLPDDGFRRD